VVVKDECGNVILSAWKPIRYVASPEKAEAEACLHGLRLVTECVRQPVCVEADCVNLIHAINIEGDDRSRWAGVIKEIQAMRSHATGRDARLATASGKQTWWPMNQDVVLHSRVPSHLIHSN
jgi:hypothetical protein